MGRRPLAKVRRTQPAAYLKILALLVPREHFELELDFLHLKSSARSEPSEGEAP